MSSGSDTTGFKLLDLLQLEQLEENFYLGKSRATPAPQLFGGQVLGQALLAACKTVETMEAHSLHCYFLRGGDMKKPVLYEVERSRDGRTFCTRRVVAIQHGRPIFNMTVSFQLPEEGLDHQDTMPQAPGPEGLMEQRELREKLETEAGFTYKHEKHPSSPFDIRLTKPVGGRDLKEHPPVQAHWIKLKETFPDDTALHKSALAYFSDLSLISTSMFPHSIGYKTPMRVASLDHSIWFHRDFRLDDWVLYSMDSPSASGGRGLNRGQIFDLEGRLIASTVQEGLIRVMPEKTP